MSIKNNILRVAVPSPIRFPLDYLAPEELNETLLPGIRVRVPFRSKTVIGILVEITHQSQLSKKQLKPIVEIIDTKPIISKPIMDLAVWASEYYHHPIGEVFATVLPSLLRQGKPCEIKRDANLQKVQQPPKMHVLTKAQNYAVDTIVAHLNEYKPFLLYGITGSGKTEVYFQAIEAALKLNRQALILVPEIALTPQTVARFQNRFLVEIAVIHSGLTHRERLNAWLKASDNKAQIVIGTRSAIFTPMPSLSIIIVDEEHDASYKQQDGFRYSARDLAVIRAKHATIPIILGSATPSLESQNNAKSKRYHLLELSERPGNAKLPSFHIIDIRNQFLEEGLSNKLIQAMRQHLNANGQLLLFLNRRGFAPSLVCHHCGWLARCRHCDANLVLHHQPHRLYCHHCGASRSPEKQCPDCKDSQLIPLGLGTERIEKALQKHFPEVGIVRIDRDSVRKKGAMEEKLAEIQEKKSQILIGTQMLAKGHHFPDVNFVAIIDADSGFFSADLRASERIGQLLLQVSGRAGRAEKMGEVWIQTRHPEHPLLIKLLVEGYSSFTAAILEERRHVNMPPFGFLALLRAEAINEDLPRQFLQQVHSHLSKKCQGKINLFGPISSPMAKKAGRFRLQLLLQAKTRNDLHPLLEEMLNVIDILKVNRKIRWSLDVDPLDMF